MQKVFPDLFQTVNSQSYYLTQLQELISDLPCGEEFIIRDLIPLEWKKMGKSAALKLGRQFKKIIDTGEFKLASVSRKATDNSTVYRKI